MSKSIINVSIQNELEHTHYEVPAIFQDNRIKYKEPDDTIVTYDYEKNVLLRESKELRMRYQFTLSQKTSGEIEVKEFNHSMKLEIETKKIERKNQDIEISFSIDGKDFLYKIEVIK